MLFGTVFDPSKCDLALYFKICDLGLYSDEIMSSDTLFGEIKM